MKILIIFLLSLFIAGCCSTSESTKVTPREVPIVIAVPAIHDTIPASITDSTILARDTTAQVEVHFIIDDSVKSDSAKKEIKNEIKSALNTLNNLPIKPQVNLQAQPDSVHTTVTVYDTFTVVVKPLSFWEYIKIMSIGFVLCVGCFLFIFGLKR
ncbi:MAG: hypothetical protein H3C35_13010 [Bacteroidetes bacterium]|nr:hypothetical protein [Bacteroidota bacterium]